MRPIKNVQIASTYYAQTRYEFAMLVHVPTLKTFAPSDRHEGHIKASCLFYKQYNILLCAFNTNLKHWKLS